MTTTPQEHPPFALPHPNERITLGRAAKLCKIDHRELERAVNVREIPFTEELRRITLVRFGDVVEWFNARAAQAGGR